VIDPRWCERLQEAAQLRGSLASNDHLSAGSIHTMTVHERQRSRGGVDAADGATTDQFVAGRGRCVRCGRVEPGCGFGLPVCPWLVVIAIDAVKLRRYLGRWPTPFTPGLMRAHLRVWDPAAIGHALRGD
jgi:hypothetical protein